MSSSGGNGIFGLSSDYYANLEYYFGLLEAFSPDVTPYDNGIAIFLLVLSSVLLVVFSVIMVVFFLKRNVFEIRARSPFLVMLAGVCFMVVLPLTIAQQMMVLSDYTIDAEPYIFVSYFILVCATCCYGSRTIRLAVMFNARARKAVPWLMSERNHVMMCLLLGVAAMGFPLYDLYDIPDGPFAELVFFVRSDQHLWRVTVASQALVLALWVFNRNTDDIFNIAGELRLAMGLQLLVTVAGKIAEDHLNSPYNRWFGRANWGLLLAIVLFLFSVGNPIRQLLFHPLEASNPDVAKALAKRKEAGGMLAMRDCEVSTASTVSGGEFDMGADSKDASEVNWTYEKVAKNPEVSAAFDEFSRKALCQESVLFLKAVTSYQSRSNGGWAAPAGASSYGGDDDKHSAFTDIVHQFIKNGAPDEVNISSEDKSAIFNIHEAGKSGFGGMHHRERRFVFAHAYAEVRYVLESNLMTRFVSSDGFKAAARRAGTVV